METKKTIFLVLSKPDLLIVQLNKEDTNAPVNAEKTIKKVSK